MVRGLMAVALLGVVMSGGTLAKEEGGVFNLRIVSDSVPDFSSRKNFVHSALSGWETDAEKALAQFRWMHRLRRVGDFQPEDSRPVLDPVLFFNSYGITYCSMIAEINASLWETWGKANRVVDLDGHVVSEVFYDGKWHLFDNDFCNYYVTEKGEVAGIEDLANSRIHGNVEDLKPGEYYLFDHCPTASAPRGKIIMGPSAWSLIDVARYWYAGPGKFWPRLNYTGSHAGHRHILGLRPNERYARYWRPTGTGAFHGRPLNDGTDPAVGSKLRNSRSNGMWMWRPNLGDASVLFAAENVEMGNAQGKPLLRAKDPSKKAWAVFRVIAANVVTAALFQADVVEPVLFSVSGTGGVSWERVGAGGGSEGHPAAGITTPIAGRLEYLLRAEFSGGAGLNALQVETITQVNHRTLPALRLGKNEIVAVSDEHLEYITLNPRLADHAEKGEVFSAEGWQSIEKPHDYEPSVRGVGKSELVLKATAPRDIKHVRMAGTLHLTEPGTDTYLQCSFDGGKTWKELGHVRFPGAPYDKRVSFETRDIPPGTREVLLKYFFDWGGNGLVNVFAEAGFEPAGPRMPIDVTYAWSEFRDGRWVDRQHVERVAEPYHKYTINLGGTRPPRMNALTISPVDQAAKLGYGDGEDVGDKFARPGYRLTYGKKISTGCPYTASRPPSEAYPDCLPVVHPKADEQTGWARPPRVVGTKEDARTLTDDYVGIADFWGGDNISLSGKKNEKRVGEFVAWEPGSEVVVTLDLGKVQLVGGAAIAALQPNKTLLYPATMAVEVSSDGKTFTKAGATTWEECFFPPADGVLWEGHDSPLYDDLPAGGIRDFKFPVILEKPIQARYVRFRLSPPTDPKAGIALWELDVFDTIKRELWSDRVQLPVKP